MVVNEKQVRVRNDQRLGVKPFSGDTTRPELPSVGVSQENRLKVASPYLRKPRNGVEDHDSITENRLWTPQMRNALYALVVAAGACGAIGHLAHLW